MRLSVKMSMTYISLLLFVALAIESVNAQHENGSQQSTPAEQKQHLWVSTLLNYNDSGMYCTVLYYASLLFKGTLTLTYKQSSHDL